MSERIVNDPSQHGWVETDDGKWVWDASGGAGAGMVISETEPTDKVEGMQWLNPTTGLVLFWDDEKWLQMPTTGSPGADGNIADATEQGVVATWDDTAKQWTPDDAVVVSGGNVGIGTNAPATNVHIRNDNSSAALRLQTQKSGDSARIDLLGGDRTTFQSIQSTDDDITFVTGNAQGRQEALTIDATGDATFSGTVSADNVSAGNSVSSGSNIYVNAPAGGTTKPRLRYSGVDVSGEFCIRDDDAAVDRFKISKEGDATFSGNITTGQRLYSANGGGLSFGGSAVNIVPCLNDGTITDGVTDLGSGGPSYSNYRFRNGYFSGQVWAGDAPLTRTVDLIETLSTLRNATKDETTLEGLRDAIGNAVGGLIEKFEAMQEVATQEISDE